jgi:hypothetical protein
MESHKEKWRTGLTRSQTFLQLQAYEIEEGESQGQGEIFRSAMPKREKPDNPTRVERSLKNRKSRRLIA